MTVGAAAFTALGALLIAQTVHVGRRRTEAAATDTGTTTAAPVS
ncbi:hypothetical protein [Streptomyces sp. NPDC090445]